MQNDWNDFFDVSGCQGVRWKIWWGEHRTEKFAGYIVQRRSLTWPNNISAIEKMTIVYLLRVW